MPTKAIWKFVAVAEILVAAAVVLLDFFIPTLVILAMALISLLIRREHIRSLGFNRPASWARMVGFAFIVGFLLQLFHVGLSMPILNWLTGTTLNMGGVASLQGNVTQLVLLLVLSWTLAAVGEELVYRGYLQKLLASVVGSALPGLLVTVGVSSLLFGLAHTEQGLIGVFVTTWDALVFSWLKLRFKNNLWAAVFAHGFYNSVGIVVFYFTGPISGLW